MSHLEVVATLQEKILTLLQTKPLLINETQEQRNATILEIQQKMSDQSLHTRTYLEGLHDEIEAKYSKYQDFEHSHAHVHFANLELMKPVFDVKLQEYVLGPVQTIKMMGAHLTVGKDETCDIDISHSGDNGIPETTLRFISKHHFTICYDDVTGTFYLINKSRNGTLVDGFLVTTEPFVLSGSMPQRPNGPMDLMPQESRNEIRIGEILLGRDPLLFTLNTCVFRFNPVDVRMEDM